MELGSVTLKRIGFFCFPMKHSTHTQLLRAIRLMEDHSSRGGGRRSEAGQVPDWEESQMLAALAVSELPAALQ